VTWIAIGFTSQMVGSLTSTRRGFFCQVRWRLSMKHEPWLGRFSAIWRGRFQTGPNGASQLSESKASGLFSRLSGSSSRVLPSPGEPPRSIDALRPSPCDLRFFGLPRPRVREARHIDWYEEVMAGRPVLATG
jgi:hypothetical protein